jgi:radical SAM protein with 4Fe4S-binding SPASM domain
MESTQSFNPAETKYVVPPEYHVFEQAPRFLVLDPVNFVWFVTDKTGKIAFEGLAKTGDPSDAATALAQLAGVPAGTPKVQEYVSAFVRHLVNIKFLHVQDYQPRDWGPGVLPRPTTMYVHLTNKCNLKCPYCYNQDHRTELIQLGRTPGSNMVSTEGTTEELLRVIDEAAELGFQEIKFTGGEALVNKDALKIAARAKSHGLYVNLLTNGILITEEIAREIAQVVDAVSISLDSDKPEEHDAVRGAGTHKKVLEAIRMLKDAGVKYLHVNAVFTPVNMNSAESFLGYAWDHIKADKVTIAGAGINDDVDGKFGAQRYMLDGDQFRVVEESARKFYQIRSASQPPPNPGDLWRKQCGVGNGLISIDPNGDAYPCQTLHRPEFLCGNVFETGLRHVLEHSQVMQQMKATTVDILPECKSCPVRYICSGGCRSEAYTREGDFLARNRAMCPQFFENAVQKLWNAAKTPLHEDNGTAPPPHTHAHSHPQPVMAQA